MGEACQRCGEFGYDRRTLWMACFYEMNELGLPFEQVQLSVVDQDSVVESEKNEEFTSTTFNADGTKHVEKGFYKRTLRHAKEGAAVDLRGFYTLRVCKKCRGDWIGAIKGWWVEFREVPKKKESGK